MKNRFFYMWIICSFFILKNNFIFSSNKNQIKSEVIELSNLKIINNFLFPKNIFDLEANQVSFKDFLEATSDLFLSKEDYNYFLNKVFSSSVQFIKNAFIIDEFKEIFNFVDHEYLNNIIISRLALEYLIRYLNLTDMDNLKLDSDHRYSILIDGNTYKVSFYKDSNLESLIMAIFIGVCSTNNQMIIELGEELYIKIITFLYSNLSHVSTIALEDRAIKYLPRHLQFQIKSIKRSDISVFNFLMELSKLKGYILELKKMPNKSGFSPGHIFLISTVKKLKDNGSLISFEIN